MVDALDGDSALYERDGALQQLCILRVVPLQAHGRKERAMVGQVVAGRGVHGMWSRHRCLDRLGWPSRTSESVDLRAGIDGAGVLRDLVACQRPRARRGLARLQAAD